VPSGSTIQTISEVDRLGIRVGVPAGGSVIPPLKAAYVDCAVRQWQAYTFSRPSRRDHSRAGAEKRASLDSLNLVEYAQSGAESLKKKP
jgi:hypothetical protein